MLNHRVYLGSWLKYLLPLVMVSLFLAKSAFAYGPYSSAYLRGNFNNWGNTAMTDTSGGVVWDIANVRFCGSNPQEFKIDVSGNWTTAFGGTDKTLLAAADFAFVSPGTTAKNLRLSTNGIYSVRFVATSTYAYVEVHKSGECIDTPLPAVYLRGTFNAWGLLAMTPVTGSTTDYTSEVTFGTTTTERFKFDLSNNWSNSFGENNNPPDFIADAGGQDIKITQGGGKYRITFNRDSKRYTVQKLSMATCQHSNMLLMSSARNFGAGADSGKLSDGEGQKMNCVNGIWEATEIFAGTGSVFHAGAYLLATDINFGTFWGGGNTAGKLAPSGTNLILDEGQQGTYDFRFNDRTLEYSAVKQPANCTTTTMNVRGTFNGWGNQSMYCVGTNLWAAIVMFNNASEYKFDTYGNWTSNYGDAAPADGIADVGAPNIVQTKPGRYLITFDLNTRQYTLRPISRACKYQQMQLMQTSNYDNGTSRVTAMPMECENGHWALEHTFPSKDSNGITIAKSSIKFQANGLTQAFGDNSPELIKNDVLEKATLGEASIPVTAEYYHIHFYDRDIAGPSIYENPNHYRLCRSKAVLAVCHE
jgi:hypothetical protein